MTFSLGAIVGKFLPPHRGHSHLIRTARTRCTQLVVFVCQRPRDFVPADTRADWLREIHPDVDFRTVDDRYDENDSHIWAENVRTWLGRAPDAVFTSEDYGPVFAGHLGCSHVMVDRQRTTVPISGSLIRQDPYIHWDHIDAPVRAHFARRICVVGAESTGTTTLAQALADHYRTCWVEEYGREYSWVKQQRGETDWLTQEFTDIALEQCRREDAAARQCNRILICDTNAFATILWHQRYMGFHSPAVESIAAGRRYDLYFLTDADIPFVQDGLRDGQHIRQEMHTWFVKALQRQSTPWRLLSGPHEKRLAEATAAINALFAGSAWSA